MSNVSPYFTPKPPKYSWVYFFQDGGVTKLHDDKPDSILFEQAYLVMVSVPAKQNQGQASQAAYVEIVKADNPANLILTANVPAKPEPARACKGGDYCDEVCLGPGKCGLQSELEQ